jgi:membrane-bound inhibitor of C-type lysozyme
MKIGIAVCLVLILALGWYMLTNSSEVKKYVKPAYDTPSVSFMCADNTHFIAEFLSPNDVTIRVDGTITRKLPKVPGDGQRFEDSEYVYVFAGEEATVAQKNTGILTTCAQPFDANNAPVNFGDAAEGGGVKPDTALIVSESVIGKWQDTTDAKFVREFKKDGIVVDTYDSKDPHTGTWVVFTKQKPREVPFPLEESATYIQLSIQDNYTDVLNFKITAVTPETLELTFMDRGGVLTFKRI